MEEEKLDALIDLLAVELLTAHPSRVTPLIARLAKELAVDIRRGWRPEAAWLKGFQKVQLAHLIGEIRGPAYRTAAERKKKSELVESLDKLFADAAEGRMEDKALADKLNVWLPANLREPAEETPAVRKDAA